MKVLYFTGVPLAAADNGGSLCCRNHVQRLHEDPAIDLVAVTAGPATRQAGQDAFFAGLGVPHRYVTITDAPAAAPAAGRLALLRRFDPVATFQFDWEMRARGQAQVETAVAAAIREHAVDTLVIDYLPSTLFLRLPRRDAATALITLNREGDFYRDRLRLRHTPHGPWTAGISLLRARRYERRIHAAVDQVITIGPPDLPRRGTRRPAVCITPHLDPRPERWDPSAPPRIFFVGAIGHYPNRLAIEWLVRGFAPALAACGSDATIAILGADPAEVPEAPPNIQLLGRGDRAEATRLFQASALMICPVANDYGVKFKALEALAHGTPLLASRQTMAGLPQLAGLPAFDLAAPAEAAALAARLIADPAGLRALADSQQARQAAFMAGQAGIWSRTLPRP